MLKGVNRQILEITNPESPYFEKIVFYVKPEGYSQGEEKLKSEAEKFSDKRIKPPKTRRSRKEAIQTVLCIFLGLGAGAALTVVMGIIS